MINIYITFGQSHTHSHNGKTLDKDCVGVIKAKSEEKARELAFEWFDGVFATTYTQEYLNRNPDFMDCFPRGFIELN